MCVCVGDVMCVDEQMAKSEMDRTRSGSGEINWRESLFRTVGWKQQVDEDVAILQLPRCNSDDAVVHNGKAHIWVTETQTDRQIRGKRKSRHGDN